MLRKFVLLTIFFLCSGCLLTKEKLFDNSQSRAIFSDAVLIYVGNAEDSFVLEYIGNGSYIKRGESTASPIRVYPVGDEDGQFFVFEDSGSGRITHGAADYLYIVFKIVTPVSGRAKLEVAGLGEDRLYEELAERQGLKIGSFAAKSEDRLSVLAVIDDLIRNWGNLERASLDFYDLMNPGDRQKATKLVGEEMLR